MGKVLRLFWAVNIPAEIKNEIAKLQGRLKKDGAGTGAKWVDARNLHVTVKFLGDTRAGEVGRISGVAAGRLNGMKSFSLGIGGLGFFPGPACPRVFWAGIKGETDRLKELVREMEAGMAECGFPPERRKFSPHLTLARLKSSGNTGALAGAVESGLPQAADLGMFKVTAVDLMQSDLIPRGPVYSLISSVVLT